MGSQYSLTTVGQRRDMSEVKVSSASGDYIVHIGARFSLTEMPHEKVFLVDSAVTDLIQGDEKVIEIVAEEKNKTLQSCEHVIREMKAFGMNRKSTLVAVGGGYVQDIATLSCALYMRGINWQYFPTTLMSMMDSCVGGKSSINVGNFKNLVGNFYPPKEIFVDLSFTESLDKDAIACGLLEGLKICYARGPEDFKRFRELRRSSSTLNCQNGEDFVEHVLKCKKWFIENDEFDTGVRQLLNFGHTFGHALEAACNFAIPHGIAIGIGMLAAIDFAREDESELEFDLEQEILEILEDVRPTVRRGFEIFDSQIFGSAFDGDKKHTSSLFRPVLSIHGKLKIKEIDRSNDVLEKAVTSINRAFEKFLEK